MMTLITTGAAVCYLGFHRPTPPSLTPPSHPPPSTDAETVNYKQLISRVSSLEQNVKAMQQQLDSLQYGTPE